MRVALVVSAVFLTGCLDLTIPPAPTPPGPGTVQGTVVYAVSGRTSTKPAGGAKITLVNTTIETTADEESGRFVLEGITVTSGQVRITFDADGDGVVDRQKTLDLANLKAGPGRDVVVGEVTLSRNAVASGRVLRSDVILPVGHAGTTVFVPNAAFSAISADDGSYVIENLPEGTLQLGFFRAGYVLETREVQVFGGQEARLITVSLKPEPPGAPAMSTLTGTVVASNGEAVAGAHVRALNLMSEVMTDTNAEGAFTLTLVASRLYRLAFEAPDKKSLLLNNVYVGPETTDLGPITLAAGTSTRIDLSPDGGPSLGTDGGGSNADKPVAAIGPIVDSAPDSDVLLSGSVISGGRPPFRYQWAQADGGTEFNFVPNGTLLPGTKFKAPPTARLIDVSLVVRDSNDTLSAPVTARVKVGVKPVIQFATTDPSATSGQIVTIDARPTHTTDGQAITSYKWQLVSGTTTGPHLAEIASCDGGLLTYKAPDVITPEDVGVSLTVTTELGFVETSPEKKTTINPVPAWSVDIGSSLPSPIDVTSNNMPVALVANILNAPAGTPTYAWSVVSCPAGVNCSFTNPTSNSTNFTAPVANVTLEVQVEVTIAGVNRNTKRTFQFFDRSLPTCTPSLSQIALRIACTKDMPTVGTGSISGFSQAEESPLYDPLTRTYVVRLRRVYDPTLPLSLTISGFQDLSGNVAPMFQGMLTPTYSGGFHIRSQGTSTVEPRPGWLSLTTDAGTVNRLVGRLVNAVGDATVWSVNIDDAGFGCTVDEPCTTRDTTPLQGVRLDAGAMPVNKTVVNLGSKGYVALSVQQPAAMATVTLSGSNEVWSYLSGTPPFMAMGSINGKISIAVPESMGVKRYEHNNTSWIGNEGIIFAGMFGPAASATFVTDAPGVPYFMTTAAGSMPDRFPFNGASWSGFAFAGGGALEIGGGSAYSDNTLFKRSSSTSHLERVVVDSGGAPTTTELFAAPITGFDAVAWGSSTLIAFAHNGQIYVNLYDPTDGSFAPIAVTSGTDSFNSESSAVHYLGQVPRLTVIGTEVGVAWQESPSMNQFYMCARRIR